MSISKIDFGFFNGYKAYLFTLTNKNGMTVKLTNYSGAVVSVTTPDKDGNFEDVVLGYDNLEGYVNGNSSHGAFVGRYANRIGKGSFTINGVEYHIALNDGGVNTLHGGNIGFNKRIMTIENVKDGEEPAVTFGYISPDEEENFPGTLTVKLTYTLTAENGLKIEYKATTDKDTVVNLTNHSYFNLAGCNAGSVLDHIVQINADKYTLVDSRLIPTGEIASVKDTPFDFTTPKTIGKDIENGRLPGGYDHNYVLGEPHVMRTAAVVTEPNSGRVMTVKTDKPAIQFYIGNGLDGETGKNGKPMKCRTGFCLESQFYPDSPNHDNFPSCILRKGDEYNFTTIYEFSTVK